MSVQSLAERRVWQRGFTLLELMVVLVVIGILTAAVAPVMRGTLEAELLHAQSRRVVGAIDVAYSRAVTLGRTHRVVLDLADRKYYVEGRVEADGGQSGYSRVPYVSGSEGELDSRISIQIRGGRDEPNSDANAGSVEAQPVAGAGVGWITLHPDGTAEEVEIVFQDRQGFRQAMRLNPVTARVRIRPLPPA